MDIIILFITFTGNSVYITLGDRLAPYNKKFRFFITTKLGNPHFPPEVCTKATLVNFAIKREGKDILFYLNILLYI